MVNNESSPLRLVRIRTTPGTAGENRSYFDYFVLLLKATTAEQLVDLYKELG